MSATVAFSYQTEITRKASSPDGEARNAAARKLFVDKVAPVIRRRCLGCHGEGDKLEANLDLRSRAGALKGGDSGPALVPGKPRKSPLFQAVLRTGNVVMPPKERNKLTVEEIAALKSWISAGAVWPQAAIGGKPGSNNDGDSTTITVSTSGGQSPDWTNRTYQRRDLWAYQPVRRVPIPWTDAGLANRGNPIDAFIHNRLRQATLQPAAVADQVTLLRRVTLSLTGLPPTAHQVQSFVDDQSKNAFDKVVTRLLNSDRYGEHLARHWLDVVRYADTAGFANDYERPNAWRYRDYVIRSFNQDKPFDRFVIEQMAGDELDPSDPELLIAVGFLRMGPWEHTGMSVAAVTRQQYLDDITHSVGLTFLAQGLRCARCHDHKFDPIPTRDYYRIQSVFAPVQFADREVDYRKFENVAEFAESKKRTEARLKEANDYLAALRKKSQQALAKYLKLRGVKSVSELSIEERGNARFFGLSALEKSLNKIYSKRKAYFEREMKRYRPFAFSVYSGPFRLVQSNRAIHTMPASMTGDASDVHVLKGGSLEFPIEKVGPGVLSAVAGSNAGKQPTVWNTIPESTSGRRLALARWIASPNNSLTARVIVNRIWQIHFGKGLVATANNFGKMGVRPTHPELLDWLTIWFVEHGWSIKRLNRLIVTSATFGRSSRHRDMPKLQQSDPRNDLLAYFSARRLAAEEIRDGMLAISGELKFTMGGPGIYPEINWEVARQPRHIMGSVAPAYQPSPRSEQRNRRTIYAFRYRTLADPMLEVFNRPGSDVSCERRDETTVTPQVFALFNGQFVHDRALALADAVRKSNAESKQQIEQVFRRVYGRDPNPDESKACEAHVANMLEHHRRNTPKVVKPPTVVIRQMIEELTGESFEWDEPLDVMESYQSDVKPWDVDPETRALAELCLVLLNSNEFLYLR